MKNRIIQFLTRTSVAALLPFVIIMPLIASGNGRYRDPDNVNKRVHEIKDKHNDIVRVHPLATSPGGTDLLMMEIGTSNDVPAIMVVGNLKGICPISTEAALSLAERIAGDATLCSKVKWYILPMGNPDASRRFFSSPLYADSGNGTAVNDDNDDKTDEDGYNDLDRNGIITLMRVKSPDGTMIPFPGDKRLMIKADPSKGERGIYKIYSEGIDDDGDGMYNEDTPGGTDVDINFPHLFKAFDKRSGLFPGSEPESNALLKFSFEHPEIAMIISFGQSNYFLVPPQGGRKAKSDMERITVPEDVAKEIGLDPKRRYSMTEIMEAVQPLLPQGMVVDEAMVASFMGLGAIVNPLPDDMLFYNSISAEYKEYLRKKGVTATRFDPESPEDGSFELWAYYQYGVPVFTMDFWALPKQAEEKKDTRTTTPQSAAKMPDEAEKQKADLKEVALLAFSDTILGGKGFIDWKSFSHPTLGEVEIGGFVPFAGTTPPEYMIDSLLDIHLPWILEMAKKIPSLKITETKVTPKGAGIYQLDIWVTNEGLLPFPTAMGKRNKVPAPAILTLESPDTEILSGKKRTTVNALGALKSEKYTFLIHADGKRKITFKLESKQAGSDTEVINTEG